MSCINIVPFYQKKKNVVPGKKKFPPMGFPIRLNEKQKFPFWSKNKERALPRLRKCKFSPKKSSAGLLPARHARFVTLPCACNEPNLSPRAGAGPTGLSLSPRPRLPHPPDPPTRPDALHPAPSTQAVDPLAILDYIRSVSTHPASPGAWFAQRVPI